MNYAYWLASIPGIGNITIRKLLQKAGSAGELFAMPERQLRAMKILGEKELQSFLLSRRWEWEREYDKVCAMGIRFLSMEDEDYPGRLAALWDAPYGIYVKGSLPDEKKKTVAIVGARMCSEYGRAIARELARQLALHGACVVSGMARGIDAAGHRGALLGGGETAAVLGCGVDICYPASNRGLYSDIIENGCVISEYPPGAEPLAGHFPARNRMIAGLCDVLAVVEAKEKSGSLITADCALDQGKDVYAVPGRIGDALSMGTNALIHQGAGIISNIGEFLKDLQFGGTDESGQQNFKKLLLEKEERLVYSCVDLRPKNIEELLRMTELSVPVLTEILAKLTQKGFVTETFKNCYIRKM